MKDWKEITLKQYELIQDLLVEPDDYTTFNILDLVYDINSSEMTINEVKKYSIEFLTTSIPNVKLEKKYILNGTEYNSNFDLTQVTTAQFVDYQNYLKLEGNKINKLLSVFFIPTGHKYNDGYDMKKVQEDMYQLDICTVQSAAFFFARQLTAFAHLFQHYLIQSIKKMRIDKEKKKELLGKLQEMDFTSLVSYHLSSNTVK